jgi:hypothetical protein
MFNNCPLHHYQYWFERILVSDLSLKYVN